MPTQTRGAYYTELAQQATKDEAGGLAKPNAVLLLWFLRNVIGIGDFEAYENVTDHDDDHGIDGLFLEPSAGDEGPETLVIFQSKYTDSADGKVGPTEIDRLAGTATHFVSADAVRRLLAARLPVRLRGLIEDFELEAKLDRDPSSVQVRLALVTSGLLNSPAKRQVENLRDEKGPGYMEVWTIDELGPLAIAVRSPERIADSIEIRSTAGERLIAGESPNRIAVVPVSAEEVAGWPGIADRSLFALNVRGELGPNKVSKGLDGAIVEASDHRDFLAYHNGLTVICDSFEVGRGKVTVCRPSVANGAQSVLAFTRGLDKLTDDLRVFVKLVEVEGRPLLEKEVSRRSNTQTRVSPRNLMANSGPQLRLQRAFEDSYPDITYVTRPDTVSPATGRQIRNDDAAQLLCAVYNEWPWLAVKRDSLFESENHPHIFNETVTPEHILLCERVSEAVAAEKDQFPDDYLGSWSLVRLTAVYLVGQIAHAAAEDSPSILDDPADALASESLDQELRAWARLSAAVLRKRNRALGDADDYRKDLKNQSVLVGLGNDAREMYEAVQALSTGSTD